MLSYLNSCHSERSEESGLPTGARVVTALAGASLNEIEKHAITETLAKTKANREKPANCLAIGERTLYRKIKEYNL